MKRKKGCQAVFKIPGQTETHIAAVLSVTIQATHNQPRNKKLLKTNKQKNTNERGTFKSCQY